jgi:hypothetical protein
VRVGCEEACLALGAPGYDLGMSDVKLNWESAEVKDATLSVQLEGDVSEEWQANFQTTAKLLGGQWGEVELDDDSVKVGDLGGGDEEKVRHYLESVVTQANASIDSAQSDDEDSKDEDSDDEEEKPKDEDDKDEGSEDDDGERDRKDPDSEMTERFRSFGSKGEQRESESESSESQSESDSESKG